MVGSNSKTPAKRVADGQGSSDGGNDQQVVDAGAGDQREMAAAGTQSLSLSNNSVIMH